MTPLLADTVGAAELDACLAGRRRGRRAAPRGTWQASRRRRPSALKGGEQEATVGMRDARGMAASLTRRLGRQRRRRPVLPLSNSAPRSSAVRDARAGRDVRAAPWLYSRRRDRIRHDLTRGDHEATHHPRERVPHRRRRLGPPPVRRAHPAARTARATTRYFVAGSEKNALIDTVDPAKCGDAHRAARRAAGAGLPRHPPRGAGPLGLHAAAARALPRAARSSATRRRGRC